MSEWISVGERLPPRMADNCSYEVDVWIGDERWPEVIYDFLEEEWYDACCGVIVSEKVTHWMEKPVPPPEEK